MTNPDEPRSSAQKRLETRRNEADTADVTDVAGAGGVPRRITNEMLREIRNNTDWRALFDFLGLSRDRKSTEADWWAVSPLNPDEKHASFHMNDKGWKCFSTEESGYVIELVQKVMEYRTGRVLSCYEAGRWLVENGLSRVSVPGRTDSPARSASVATGPFDPGIPSFSGDPSDSAVLADKPDRAGVPENRPEAGTECYTGNIGGSDSGRESDVGKAETGRDDGDSGEKKTENRPIRQTLLPALTFEHPEFEKRGISRETCEYLGCGFLSSDSSQSPLAGRIVFQVRGVREDEKESGSLKPVILTHVGRALTEEQEEADGKWKYYSGFSKTLELYNIDHMLLDEEAVRQARETGHVIVTEGCFDVAKLVEAGIKNAVATFGWSLSEEQIPKLRLISERTGVNTFLFCFDRDTAGLRGLEKAREMLKDVDTILSSEFDWEMSFPSPVRGNVKIPEEIGDMCEFSVEQLRWLRDKGLI